MNCITMEELKRNYSDGYYDLSIPDGDEKLSHDVAKYIVSKHPFTLDYYKAKAIEEHLFAKYHNDIEEYFASIDWAAHMVEDLLCNFIEQAENE